MQSNQCKHVKNGNSKTKPHSVANAGLTASFVGVVVVTMVVSNISESELEEVVSLLSSLLAE